MVNLDQGHGMALGDTYLPDLKPVVITGRETARDGNRQKPDIESDDYHP